jgi:hypothetical protein
MLHCTSEKNPQLVNVAHILLAEQHLLRLQQKHRAIFRILGSRSNRASHRQHEKSKSQLAGAMHTSFY